MQLVVIPRILAIMFYGIITAFMTLIMPLFGSFIFVLLATFLIPLIITHWGYYALFNILTLFLFTDKHEILSRLFKRQVIKVILNLNLRAQEKPIARAILDLLNRDDHNYMRKVGFLLSLYSVIIVWRIRKLGKNVKHSIDILMFTFASCAILIWYNDAIDLWYDNHRQSFLTLVRPVRMIATIIWSKKADLYETIYGLHQNATLSGSYFILVLTNTMLETDLLLNRHFVARRKYKYSKAMRSSQVIFARFVDSLRVPQMVRNSVNWNFNDMSDEELQELIDTSLNRLREMGYPCDETEGATPLKLKNTKYDLNWLVGGTNWRIHQPTIKTYVQHEFDRFRKNIIEYKYSLTYANHENQLDSIARYFSDTEIKFDTNEKVFNAVWDVLKPLYRDSKIMPLYAILKGWNKKFNVGVFASSVKRNKFGGFRKKKRAEWITQLGGLKPTLDVFKNLLENAYTLPVFAQFFTKLENLPPNKWLKDKIRTPVAAMLPQYLAQMSFVGEPNKRFLYEETPIKLGMPLKGSVMSRLWERHARFNKHFAGDCTAFDSTIAGPVIDLIKMVRKKGFQAHKEQRALEWLIDTTYSAIEKALLVSAQTGNVYRKGTGLMTGHASTSADNSMVMVALYLAAWVKLTGRSAAEFKSLNELSVYGDDHVLSISDLAPSVWNWDNIVKTMKSWNIEMREEIPSNGQGLSLNQVPFLKKYCKKPDTFEKQDFIRVFGRDPPEYITYHDPNSLRGKAFANVTNNNPTYRVQRLISFMYLCAHNKEDYVSLHMGIKSIFRRFPNVKAQLEKQVPGYDRVLKVWYDDKETVPLMKTEETPDFENDESDEYIYMFGEIGVFEKLANTLSLVPDLINPVLRAMRSSEYAQKVLHDLLSWPKALLAHTNEVTSTGHLKAITDRSPYDFLSSSVPQTCDANISTLLLRHWIYMSFSSRKPKSYLNMLNGVQNKIFTLNFMLNGFVPNTVSNLYFPYYNMMLVAALNLIKIPEIPAANALTKVRTRDFVGDADDLIASWINLLLNKIPTSFKDLEAPLTSSRQILAVAPTGSGKSTDMVNHIYTVLGGVRNRFIVVVPRVALAHGLYQYMSGRFDVVFGVWTGEKKEQLDADILYVTPGIFLLSQSKFLNKRNQIIVDECHLPELQTRLLISILKRSREYVVYTSATPSTTNLLEIKGLHVNLPSSNPYMYDKVELKCDDNNNITSAYVTMINSFCRGHNPMARKLIFVDSFSEMEICLAQIRGKAGTISSKGVDIPKDCTVIVATSAADVGVTIPDVDFVFTKNIIRKNDRLGVRYVLMDDLLLKQRWGRTGRTGKGTAITVTWSGSFITTEPQKVMVDDAILFCIQHDIPLENLKKEYKVPLLRDIKDDFIPLLTHWLKERLKLVPMPDDPRELTGTTLHMWIMGPLEVMVEATKYKRHYSHSIPDTSWQFSYGTKKGLEKLVENMINVDQTLDLPVERLPMPESSKVPIAGDMLFHNLLERASIECYFGMSPTREKLLGTYSEGLPPLNAYPRFSVPCMYARLSKMHFSL
ncbi:RNA-dependent RNA polymerase [Rhizoctonia solani fusarivirus 2]|uniref:RNA-dependent RNA polymerase n=1 Tax=Rhizoctonia solani fusarivirus 2 TaxID=2599954 RepID=A0AAE6HYP2_9VIRU|nr:RNA-dependent RNA polymerase [Rhizoctonia solani fusarivirus 2]QDW92691.1 RNA-dependent RNA polymerase [Rhizoctonia solani fusarivirus 2]